MSGQCESSQQSGAEQETQAHRTEEHDRRHHRAASLGLRCICVRAAAALSPSAGVDPSLEMNVAVVSPPPSLPGAWASSARSPVATSLGGGGTDCGRLGGGETTAAILTSHHETPRRDDRKRRVEDDGCGVSCWAIQVLCGRAIRLRKVGRRIRFVYYGI